MNRLLLRLYLILCVVVLTGAYAPAYAQSIATRQDALTKIANTNHGPLFATVAACLKTGIRTADAYRQLDSLLASENGDMFWMYGCAGLYHACKSDLSPDLKERIRTGWKVFTPYR